LDLDICIDLASELIAWVVLIDSVVEVGAVADKVDWRVWIVEDVVEY